MSVLVLSLAALGMLLGVALLGYGLRELGFAYRLFAREPHTVLDTPNGGSVELSGTVLAWDDVLESPFTETACVAVEYAVEEKRRKSTNTGSTTKWVEIDGGTQVVPFRLEDESGNVLVNPRGADLRLTADARIRVEEARRHRHRSPTTSSATRMSLTRTRASRWARSRFRPGGTGATWSGDWTSGSRFTCSGRPGETRRPLERRDR
ncbi:GIDE domain-containing protein [Saliphagus sp. GCM10025308]